MDHLAALVQKRNIETIGISKALTPEALMLSRPSGRVSFADAVIWATARQQRISRVMTVDRQFPADGLEVVS